MALACRANTAARKALWPLCSKSRGIYARQPCAVVQAAGVYTELYQRGALIGDADILIAASALVHGMVLVINNGDHFTGENNASFANTQMQVRSSQLE